MLKLPFKKQTALYQLDPPGRRFENVMVEC